MNRMKENYFKNHSKLQTFSLRKLNMKFNNDVGETS